MNKYDKIMLFILCLFAAVCILFSAIPEQIFAADSNKTMVAYSAKENDSLVYLLGDGSFGSLHFSADCEFFLVNCQGTEYLLAFRTETNFPYDNYNSPNALLDGNKGCNDYGLWVSYQSFAPIAINGTSYYYCAVNATPVLPANSKLMYSYWTYSFNESVNSISKVLEKYLNGEITTDDISFSDGESLDDDPNAVGTSDNPVYDSSIGNIVLTDSTHISVNNGNVVTSLFLNDTDYRDFKWKRKTDTGFNLCNNDYVNCKVQIYAESYFNRVKLAYRDCASVDSYISEKNNAGNFDSYGERGLVTTLSADNLRATVSYDDIMDALPNTKEEASKYSQVAYVQKITFWFRIICSNDLQVIPNENSGNWVCGGWVSHTVYFDDLASAGVESGTTAYDLDDDGNLVENSDSSATQDNVNNTSVLEADDIDDGKEQADTATKVTDYDGSASNSTIDTVFDTMESLITNIGRVPKLIAKIFSFLPAWCLNFVALMFSTLVILVIYRLIRG